jgi:hypothetical protein
MDERADRKVFSARFDSLEIREVDSKAFGERLLRQFLIGPEFSDPSPYVAKYLRRGLGRRGLHRHPVCPRRPRTF